MSVYAAAATITSAAGPFLNAPAAVQLERLRAAWLTAPRPGRWLCRLLADSTGIDWPLLRRRLRDWAGALPTDTLLDPATIYAPVAAAFGPLADTHTHGFRTVDRAPWQPRRAAAVLEAALRGPLAWLGYVTRHVAPGHRQKMLIARPRAPRFPADTPWRYGEPGTLHIPHGSSGAAALRLTPYAVWEGDDGRTMVFRLTAASIACAARHGHTTASLVSILEQSAGPLPQSWHGIVSTRPSLRATAGVTLLADTPAVLNRAAKSRSVRRYLSSRPAPGIALVRPEHLAPLARALDRQGITIAGYDQLAAPRPAAPPLDLTPGDCAALLVVCAYYQAHAAAGSPPLSLSATAITRLRAALPPQLAAAVDEVVRAGAPERPQPRASAEQQPSDTLPLS